MRYVIGKLKFNTKGMFNMEKKCKILQMNYIYKITYKIYS